MSLQLVPVEIWRDQAKDILELLSISDPLLLNDTGEFWNRVAMSIKLVPMDSAAANAQVCIDRVGGTWDDGYVVDGELVKEEVYGELLALLLDLPSEEIEYLQRGEYQGELSLDEDEDVIDEDISHDTTQRGIGDLVNDIINKSIQLDPRFQRQFVWQTKKAQKYIESIMLDIPTPSILLNLKGEQRLGIGDYYNVVDGRQRLETLLRFCATTEQLQSLGFTPKRFKTPKGSNEFKNYQAGGRLQEYANLFFTNFPENMQLAFKQRKIPVTVIRGVGPKTLPR